MEGGVTKNSKKFEAGKNEYQVRQLKLKEEIIAGTNPNMGGTNPTTSGTNPFTADTNPTTSGTNPTMAGTITATMPGTSTKDVYMYGVGSLAILAVGLCIFYIYRKPVQHAEDRQQTKKKFTQLL